LGFLCKIDIPDFAAAVILIYEVFPKRGLLHDITETLAVSMAEQLFSGYQAAIRFQETVAPVT
jgi:hypothetical protein